MILTHVHSDQPGPAPLLCYLLYPVIKPHCIADYGKHLYSRHLETKQICPFYWLIYTYCEGMFVAFESILNTEVSSFQEFGLEGLPGILLLIERSSC